MRRLCLGFAAILLLAKPAPAHHSPAAFSLNSQITVQGKIIDFLVEDPEYLAEPYGFTTEWDYAPQQRLLRFECDPEQARRFTFQ